MKEFKVKTIINGEAYFVESYSFTSGTIELTKDEKEAGIFIDCGIEWLKNKLPKGMQAIPQKEK
jgi:hypothetical protein